MNDFVIRLGIALRYIGFFLLFIICFAVMFVFLVSAVVGITAGLMLAVLGIAMIMFKADFIITALAPEIMLFGGLAAAFFTAFLGLVAVKMGYWICRLFVKLERKCASLRGS